jgi:hypothetical protein
MSKAALRQKLGTAERPPRARPEDPRQDSFAVSTGIDPFDEGLTPRVCKEACPRPPGYLDIFEAGTIQWVADLPGELPPKEGPVRVGCEKHP